MLVERVARCADVDVVVPGAGHTRLTPACGFETVRIVDSCD